MPPEPRPRPLRRRAASRRSGSGVPRSPVLKGLPVSKLVSPALLSLFVLACAGCQMNRPPVPSAEHAISTYHARLSESCGEKHLEALPQAEINRLAKANYKAADTQAQQLIDLRAGTECAAHDDRPACYNAGFIEAVNMTGGLPEFVKAVCGLPVKCTGDGQCATNPGAVAKAE